ncbi:DCC1-like thiol-disulfide oxidoreductase family protein [Micromonospora sp. M12]
MPPNPPGSHLVGAYPAGRSRPAHTRWAPADRPAAGRRPDEQPANPVTVPRPVASVGSRIPPHPTAVGSGFTVLFDAACPLCRAARRWLSSRAQLVPLEFVPAGSAEARRRFPGLDHDATLRDSP